VPFAKPAPVREIGMVWRRSSARATAINAVCDVICDLMQQPGKD